MQYEMMQIGDFFCLQRVNILTLTGSAVAIGVCARVVVPGGASRAALGARPCPRAGSALRRRCLPTCGAQLCILAASSGLSRGAGV
jgi:hypothetical protein